MHQDQKIGLALAVLLIGFAGAFCFRHEPVLEPKMPPLARASELDQRIEHLPVRAYTAREGVMSGTSGAVPAPVEKADILSSDLRVTESSPQPAARNRSDDTQVAAVPQSRISFLTGPPEPLRIPAERSTLPPARSASTEGSVILSGIIDDDAAVHAGPSASSQPRGASKIDRLSELRSSAAANESQHEPDFITYQVQSGDTLSELARRFLGSSRRYDELFELNRDVLPSPHDLRAGMKLRMPVER